MFHVSWQYLRDHDTIRINQISFVYPLFIISVLLHGWYPGASRRVLGCTSASTWLLFKNKPLFTICVCQYLAAFWDMATNYNFCASIWLPVQTITVIVVVSGYSLRHGHNFCTITWLLFWTLYLNWYITIFSRGIKLTYSLFKLINISIFRCYVRKVNVWLNIKA